MSFMWPFFLCFSWIFFLNSIWSSVRAQTKRYICSCDLWQKNVMIDANFLKISENSGVSPTPEFRPNRSVLWLLSVGELNFNLCFLFAFIRYSTVEFYSILIACYGQFQWTECWYYLTHQLFTVDYLRWRLLNFTNVLSRQFSSYREKPQGKSLRSAQDQNHAPDTSDITNT